MLSNLVVVLALIAGRALADSCIDVSAIKDFDGVQYLGVWYEYGRLENAFEQDTKCNQATYKALTNGSVDILNQAINGKTGESWQLPGTSTMKGDGSAESDVYFPTAGDHVASYVVGTDYKNWAAVYACRQSTEALYWIFTRTQQPSDDSVASAKAAFDEAKVDISKLFVVDQDGCQ